MKNERATEKLLAEILPKQDRHEEILIAIHAEQQTQRKVYESGFTAILDRFT